MREYAELVIETLSLLIATIKLGLLIYLAKLMCQLIDHLNGNNEIRTNKEMLSENNALQADKEQLKPLKKGLPKPPAIVGHDVDENELYTFPYDGSENPKRPF